MLGSALFLTAVTIYLGYDLSDGAFASRYHGQFTPGETPVHFAAVVLGALGFVVMTAVSWLLVWFGPEEPRFKVREEYDDPSKRNSL